MHISDPNFYEELFTGISRKRNRDPFEVQGFGLPDAVLCSPDHDMHRMRRSALAPYFSQQAISRIDPVVRGKLETLCDKLEEYRKGKQPVDVELAFMALTASGVKTFPSRWTADDSIRPTSSQSTASPHPMATSEDLDFPQIGSKRQLGPLRHRCSGDISHFFLLL